MLKSKTFWLHVLVFLALTAWSWRQWPDPLIDFGRELYVPWQLTTGKVLYRDIASLFGPVSPYINALWFTLFGTSLTTLIVCNLAILAATIAGLHYLVASACDRFTATAATMVTLMVFGFSQYVEVGNYNFIAPYSHEATHSIALAVAVIASLSHGIRVNRRWPFAVAGLAFGLLLLTKVETSVAMVVAVGTGFGGCLMLGAEARRTVKHGLALFLGILALPPFLFVLYFSWYFPIPTAVRMIGSSWTIALTTDVVRNDFYIRGMGLDDPINNSLMMLKMFVGFLMFVALAGAADRFGPTSWPASRWVAVGLRAARLGVLVLGFVYVPWFEFPRALPLIAVSAFVALVWLFVKRRHDREAAGQILPLLMWSSFAVVLLAKMFLYSRVYHYAFYLALPARILVIIVLAWLLPELLKGDGARGLTFRAIVQLVLASGVAAHLAISNGVYRSKNLSVGSGADRFLAFDSAERWHGASVREAVSRIERSMPKDATIAVVPEGVMINYLTRRENPTPFVTLMPPEILAFGEHNIREAMEQSPPDYVLRVFRAVSEYGVPNFGTDSRYGREIMEWVSSRYETIDVIGGRGLRESPQGIEILRRRVPGPPRADRVHMARPDDRPAGLEAP